MIYQTFPPSSDLAPYILNYWRLELPPVSDARKKEVILPDGNASLMFTTFPIRRTSIGQSSWMDLSGRAVFIGQKTKAVEYAFPQDQDSITWGVRFQPAGIRAFSDVPMHEYTDRIVDASSIFSGHVHQVMDLIQDEHAPGLVQSGLNHFFLKRLRTHQTPLLTTGAMASTLAVQSDTIRSVAEHFRMSTRQMERYFKLYVGLSPKSYACIMRFNRAVMEADQYPEIPVAEISDSSGYYDAIHLHRESLKICGLKPYDIFYTYRGQTRPYLTELIRQRVHRSSC